MNSVNVDMSTWAVNVMLSMLKKPDLHDSQGQYLHFCALLVGLGVILIHAFILEKFDFYQ